MNSSIRESIYVILVEPSESLNIGSVARAMGNFGFNNLRLVAPRNYQRDRANITACAGSFLIDRLTIFPSLEAALSDMEDVVGFSAREGTNRSQFDIAHWREGLTKAPLRKTALLFGPEDTGLRVEHLDQCRLQIRIPTNPECSSMNLAQAVLVALYELSRIDQAFEKQSSEELPTWNEYQQLDRIVEECLTTSGFYRDGTPAPIPRIVKNMFRRIEPNVREMGVLLGMFGRLLRTLKRERDDSQGKEP